MKKSTKYESTVKDAKTLESVIPKQLAEYTTRALSKLNEALGDNVGGYIASYTIAGLGVNFSLMPYNGLMYVVSVNDKHSKELEKDKRFDGILFWGRA